jgi:hypothetical protein
LASEPEIALQRNASTAAELASQLTSPTYDSGFRGHFFCVDVRPTPQRRPWRLRDIEQGKRPYGRMTCALA